MGSRLARPAGCGLAEATQQGACTNGRCFRRIAKRQLVRGEAGRGLWSRAPATRHSAVAQCGSPHPAHALRRPRVGSRRRLFQQPPSDTRSQPACGSPQGPGPRGWSLTSVPGRCCPPRPVAGSALGSSYPRRGLGGMSDSSLGWTSLSPTSWPPGHVEVTPQVTCWSEFKHQEMQTSSAGGPGAA